jgi:membrane protein implicated in regulation of membrane protease activity
MKLSTELAITNVVLLIALWIVSINGMIFTALALFVSMLGVRAAGKWAQDKEDAERRAAIFAKAKDMIARKFKDQP